MNKQLLLDSYKQPMVSMARLFILKKNILDIYSKKHESQVCINTIESLCKKEYSGLIINHQFDLNLFHQHSSFKIVEEDKLKLSLHIMPKGAEIPMHAHPEKLSITLVVEGILEVQHKSRFEKGLQASSNISRLLRGGDSSVGLTVLNNLHQIKALSDKTVFLSLKIAKPIENKKTIINFRPKGFITLVIYTMLATVLNSQSAVGESDNSHLQNQKPSMIQNIHTLDKLTVAKYRSSKEYNKEYEAALWYKKSASRGDPESQYWLAVMYLDGCGVNEDDDEALKWLDLAANQGYQPARKLLNHMINREYEIDC